MAYGFVTVAHGARTMGYRISYLTMRGAVYWFRMRLPKGVAKQPVPPWWPDEAAQLVGSKVVLRTELILSLDTKDYPVAKRRGAVEFMRLEAMFKEAKSLGLRRHDYTD
jgi:hypothetical protein